MKKLVAMFVILLICQNGEARVSKLEQVLFELGFIADPSVQICPEDTRIDWDSTESQLWQKAQTASSYCKAAEYLKSLVTSYPGGAHTKEAWRMYIDSFLKAQDFVMAINEANEYLDLNKNSTDSEYIHLLLLRGVDGEIKQSWRSSERQMQFVAMSLGASLTQTEDSPYLMNLNFRTFLDKYPNSQFRPEVMAMMNESRQMYGKNILSEARMFLVKMDYPTAFQKYNVILKWGPSVQVFEEALYEMVKYQYELAWIITDKAYLSDFKLNEFLKRDFSVKSTPEERRSLSEATRAQAAGYLEQMKKNLPDSKWTAEAMKMPAAYGFGQ